MNPYEVLEDLRKGIMRRVIAGPLVKDLTTETITKAEHLKEINRIIDAFKVSLDVAEYEFQFLDNKNEIVTMGEHQVSLKTLEENNTIVFQPLALLSGDIVDIDIEALSEAMQQLAETTGANIIMIPPSINVMVAKVKKPKLKVGCIEDDNQHVQQD